MNIALKHVQVMNNMADFQITKINNINLLIKKLDNKIVRILIMDTKAENGEKVFLSIKKFW